MSSAVHDWGFGQVKGATSYRVNHEICPRFKLRWQEGYGVMSL